MGARLPERSYYRTGALGNGAYGAVVCAYDEDGAEWAAKLFWDENGEEDEDNECEEGGGIDCGILREIAMLRMLNGAHPNLLSVHDVSRMENETLALIMPKMAGSLSGAIEKKTLSGKEKLKVAALSLHALAFLHEHGVIHRDLKPDNILLNAEGEPVVADFSLAKVVGSNAVDATSATAKGGKKKRKRASVGAEEGARPVLTASMGTPTYTAPEVVNGESYGLKADVFSLGVVLLELFHGSALDAEKNKHALAQIEEIKAKLSDKPVPQMIKAMLEVDPEQRVTAAEALAMIPNVEKVVPVFPTPGEVYLPTAPAGGPNDQNMAPRQGERPSKRAKADKTASDGVVLPGQLCSMLGVSFTQTVADAEHLWKRSEEARARGVVGAAACALIACKISETETYALSDVSSLQALKSCPIDAFDEYPEVELEVLSSVGYSVISRTAASVATETKPLSERQVA